MRSHLRFILLLAVVVVLSGLCLGQICGDLNGDSGYDAQDFTCVWEYLLWGIPICSMAQPGYEHPELGNVDGYEAYSINDLVYLQNFILGAGLPPICSPLIPDVLIEPGDTIIFKGLEIAPGSTTQEVEIWLHGNLSFNAIAIPFTYSSGAGSFKFDSIRHSPTTIKGVISSFEVNFWQSNTAVVWANDPSPAVNITDSGLISTVYFSFDETTETEYITIDTVTLWDIPGNGTTISKKIGGIMSPFIPSVAGLNLEDADLDGINDNIDNCPAVANHDQADADGDFVGNVCDNCNADFNPDQLDTDGDGYGNECDNCPFVSNPGQADTNLDGVGNACDAGAGIVVTSLSDTGPGSLRQAIATANTNPGPDVITFNVSGYIALNIDSPLPTLTDNSTSILGSTAPSGPRSVIIQIQLDQITSPPIMIASDSNTVEGLAIEYSDSACVEVQGNYNVIAGCYIGTEDGLYEFTSQVGLKVSGKYNLVGGPNPEDRNVITAGYLYPCLRILSDSNLIVNNFFGISAGGGGINGQFISSGIELIGTSGNIIGQPGYPPNYIGNANTGIIINGSNGCFVRNNVIGVGPDSSSSSQCEVGILLQSAAENRIGSPLVGNFITVCPSHGIELTSSGTDGNIIQNNIIRKSGVGININNGCRLNVIKNNLIDYSDNDGVFLFSNSDNNSIIQNTIANNFGDGINIDTNCDTIAIYQNHIFDNLRNGIEVVSNSRLVTISQNEIYGNDSLGINLGFDGITPNDPGDVDTGPNDLVNFPQIDSVAAHSDSSFTLYGNVLDTGIVELFLAHPVGDSGKPEDPSGYGQAFEYIDSVRADPSGKFMYTIPNSYGFYSVVSMTYTDPNGNTSEFAKNELMIPKPLIVVVYSPINVIITDPNGDRFGKFADGTVIDELVPGNGEYYEDPHDSVIINNPIQGTYQVTYLTEEGATGNETYSSIIKTDGTQEVVAVADRQVPPPGSEDVFIYEFEEGFQYEEGDANRDNSVNIVDASFIINYIFFGGAAPDPITSGDANCDGGTNIVDASYIVNYIFFGGNPPCTIQ